ncbi:MerR family transcriptional regulator [Shewanella sp. 10N.286.45.A1]|uniref:MerR family transcriptional regulator n=1 Tax=Shewanella sp. 10N.286.45.A1 TaxID=3229694 RepID=UPI00354C8345
MTQLKAETTAEAWFSIGEAAEQTGVNPVTLRAWQRRFGIVIPKRTAKGHRLYNQTHIDQIVEVLGWLDKGVAISKVKPLLKDAASGSEQTFTSSTLVNADEQVSFWQMNISYLNQCCISLDGSGLHRKLSELTAIYPFNVLKTCLFLPWLADFSKSSALSCEDKIVRSWLARELADAFSARRLALLESHNPAILLLSFGDVDDWQPILLSAELSANNIKHQQLTISELEQVSKLIERVGCQQVLLVAPPKFNPEDAHIVQLLRKKLLSKKQQVELHLWGINAPSNNSILGLTSISMQQLSSNTLAAETATKMNNERDANDS